MTPDSMIEKIRRASDISEQTKIRMEKGFRKGRLPHATIISELRGCRDGLASSIGFKIDFKGKPYF